MYATTSYIQIGTCPDLWKQGRYRVELAAELPCHPVDVDNALQQLGYHIADVGQWGRSYHNNQDHDKTIELDELDDPTAFLKLLLPYGDLDEAGICQAEDTHSKYSHVMEIVAGRDALFCSIDQQVTI